MKYFICGFAMGILAAMLTSCGSSRGVHQLDERQMQQRQRIEYRDRVQVDSVIIRDSVAVFVRGDTIRELRWRDRWRTTTRVDTAYICRVDTAYITRVEEVERKRSGFELRGGLGLVGLLVLAGLTGYAVGKLSA